MTDKDAIKILEEKLAQISKLQALDTDSQEFKQWRRDTSIALEKVFVDDDKKHAEEFKKIRFYSGIMSQDSERNRILAADAYAQALVSAKAVLTSMIDELKQWGPNSCHAQAEDPAAILSRVFKKFHALARQLRSRHGDRPTIEVEDEYDVQDFLHVLLRLYFDDIRPEEYTPSYAGGSSRMDFLLKNEQVVIETKKTRKGLTGREVGEQLIIDIARYRQHPDCKTLICFVYDPENRIGNPASIENDLSKPYDGLTVKVIVEPK